MDLPVRKIQIGSLLVVSEPTPPVPHPCCPAEASGNAGAISQREAAVVAPLLEQIIASRERLKTK